MANKHKSSWIICLSLEKWTRELYIAFAFKADRWKFRTRLWHVSSSCATCNLILKKTYIKTPQSITFASCGAAQLLNCLLPGCPERKDLKATCRAIVCFSSFVFQRQLNSCNCLSAQKKKKIKWPKLHSIENFLPGNGIQKITRNSIANKILYIFSLLPPAAVRF